MKSISKDMSKRIQKNYAFSPSNVIIFDRAVKKSKRLISCCEKKLGCSVASTFNGLPESETFARSPRVRIRLKQPSTTQRRLQQRSSHSFCTKSHSNRILTMRVDFYPRSTTDPPQQADPGTAKERYS